jgi:hypothetical protein
VAADAVGRGYSVWHGRRSFPSMTWPSLKGTYAVFIYTGAWTPPPFYLVLVETVRATVGDPVL